MIDASVAIKWVLGEPDSDLAIALRVEELIAPALWLLKPRTHFGDMFGLGRSHPKKHLKVIPTWNERR